MGRLIWHQWGRLMALTSGAWTAWGGAWAIFYRKFLWDFIDGRLGPVGIIPPPEAAPFISLIVKTPVLQFACIVNGLLTILIDWPILPNSFLYRSLVFKSVFFLQAGIIAGLLYQTADASVLYGITILAYIIAVCKAEVVGEKKARTDSV
ncbi:uncharacterized protein MELLADRAFT_86708 [Melampsora larici-populina 98AG31]|uniref:DUF7727 domain-containing protein n=1 Tax=Melampsora larici-populina (strain 98AG31 / pathotype 3-4-7) TaxID=747676 RepID=F4R335_MELLP|nr:uncharacterized protein MELLADRAFT_86708 [Melampsora larici-populina 98AG31]EGG12560.1 hypothetical protein MELLADRAFT_86708 [Melampsora larici-populina 98AG31]